MTQKEFEKRVNGKTTPEEYLNIETLYYASLDTDKDKFIYQVENVTFIAVFDGECAMAYFKAELAKAFDEEILIVELR